MSFTYKKVLNLLSKGKNNSLLSDSLHGLERECLRVTPNGLLSKKKHPQSLGSALKNPYITTDFSEAQLELITPAFKREEQASTFLKAVHCFINQNNPDELIWPFSMPCRLPRKDSDIPLGQYGTSTTGKNKTLYRTGLGERYGRKMQTVSGTHYNFSLSDDLIDLLHKSFAKKKESKTDFQTRIYLQMMRNFLRISWINTYLFGAAPAIDKSYLSKKPKLLKRHGLRTYYGPYATSLRMSNIGYYSKVQNQLFISYNSLEEYITDMTYALTTKAPQYAGKQGLNENILQIENEHYSRIRAKQSPKGKETPLQALENRGIKYLEVRAVDINPYQPIGIAKYQLRFLHICLLYCLLKPSPKLTKEEAKIITDNQNIVALKGRQPGLKLRTQKSLQPLDKLAKKLIKDLRDVATLLDKSHNCNRYNTTLDLQLEKINQPENLSSARLLREMKEGKFSYVDFGIHMAQKHKDKLDFCKKTNPRKAQLKEAADQSLEDQKKLELIESSYYPGYEDLEISTQMILKEAQRRKINFEILDRMNNVLRLTKGKKSQIIRQATFTEQDSVLSYFLMEDKALSKKILQEAGIQVPQGRHFRTQECAHQAFHKFKDQEVIVKPTDTNFGIGISFVPKNNDKIFTEALKEAFKHSDSVIVEKFISGKEYRLLVIGNKVVAISHRVPANVVGDGQSNIGQLIDQKNADPKNYKFFYKYAIRKGKEEKDFLAQQKLTFNSVPQKNQEVFLRKNSNVSTGGDSLDFTGQLHDTYEAIAVKAAKAAGATFCGVDMIIKDINKPASKDNYSIIEINFNPSLHIHQYTLNPPQTNVAAAVLDQLDF